MDFFESQETARRNTGRLILFFVLAVLGLIAITNVLVMVTLGLLNANPEAPVLQRVDWRLFAVVSLAVIGVVAFGSLFKMASLSGGGARVAEMLQGRLIQSDSRDPNERRILNIVEEMAIASGTPVPPVYLLEEEGINAFAAGYSPGDAVIGITRGAINKLSRDELQGVIAHEFSHILHGDMRINIRLIGILYGIMVLGLMGYYLLRTAALSRRSRDGNAVLFLAMGLVVIGFAGTFFGNLIKSAVSRQREFLADASAVQYTRNPAGIANALKRIGSDATGSTLENPAAAEVSHALFGDGVKSSFSNLFATHPPLEERIRKIQPNWNGEFAVTDSPAAARAPEAPRPSGAAPHTSREGFLSAILMSDALLSRAGNPSEADVEVAHELLAALPPALHEAAHDAFTARALVYLLLLDEDETISRQQLQFLQASADQAVFAALQKLRALPQEQRAYRREMRLPLINIALPALRQLSQEQYARFRKNLLSLIAADRKISLWEWVLQRVVIHQLDAVFDGKAVRNIHGRRSLRELEQQCAVVLAFLIRAGNPQGAADQAAFAKAVEVLGRPQLAMPEPAALNLQAVNTALDALGRLKPLEKPAFLKACAAGIAADDRATIEELEIFRAVAESIDCPLPPLPPMSGPRAGQT